MWCSATALLQYLKITSAGLSLWQVLFSKSSADGCFSPRFNPLSAQKERKERKWNFYVDWSSQKFGVFSVSSLRLFDR